MIARLKARIEDLGDQFWLRPALVVVACLILAHAAVLFDTPTPSAATSARRR